jgi:anthranilate phosphoribosyltransferase
MDKAYRDYLTQIISGNDLSDDQMTEVMTKIMTGKLSPSQIAGFMIGMRIKGEAIQEIATAAKVMRDHSNLVTLNNRNHLIDTCGTGGDSLQTFNVSTVSALIAAAAGARVAKHGGRSVSSKCGSADVLERMGVNVNLTHEQMSKLVDKIGIGFMFAPNYHPAMKYVAPVRKELGVRTFFNLLGPLTNPANAPSQIVGVYDSSLCSIFVQVLNILGSNHVMSVSGKDGMDEISITGPTFIAELKNKQIKEYTINPEDFDISSGNIEDIKVESVEQSEKMIMTILEGKHSTARNIATLNAGAAIYISGLTKDIGAGVNKAIEVIDSGSAMNKLNELIKNSKEYD